MAESLGGQLLLAAPTLEDPNFTRTVVLIGVHNSDGAMGVVLNRPSAVTVGEALGQLFARFPGARDRVLTEVGSVRQHVNIFVGDENIRSLGGLDTPVPRGARITILPAVSGGSLE